MPIRVQQDQPTSTQMSSTESPILDKNKAAGRVSFSPSSPVLRQSLQQEANKSNENNDDAAIEERAINDDEEAIIESDDNNDILSIITFHVQPGCSNKDCQHDHGGANNSAAPNSGVISSTANQLELSSSSTSPSSSLPATNTISALAAVSTAATASSVVLSSSSSSTSFHDKPWIKEFEAKDPSTQPLRKLCSTNNRTYYQCMHSCAPNPDDLSFKFLWNFPNQREYDEFMKEEGFFALRPDRLPKCRSLRDLVTRTAYVLMNNFEEFKDKELADVVAFVLAHSVFIDRLTTIGNSTWMTGKDTKDDYKSFALKSDKLVRPMFKRFLEEVGKDGSVIAVGSAAYYVGIIEAWIPENNRVQNRTLPHPCQMSNSRADRAGLEAFHDAIFYIALKSGYTCINKNDEPTEFDKYVPEVPYHGSNKYKCGCGSRATHVNVTVGGDEEDVEEEDGAEEGGGSSMSAFVCTDCKDRQTCGLREKNLQQDSNFIPLNEACTNCFKDFKTVGGRCSNCKVMPSTCCQEGCTHQRRIGGRCLTHAALKCASGDCTNLRQSRTSTLCRSCSFGGICSAEGCNNKAVLAAGYCASKYCPRITGKLVSRMNAKPDDQCTNVGCSRKRTSSLSICQGCYHGKCSEEGCSSIAKRKGGKCSRHMNGTCQAPGCRFVAANNGFCKSKKCPRHKKDGENQDAAKKMASSKKKKIDDSSESDGDDDGSESEDSVVEIAAVAAAASSRGRSSRSAKVKASSNMRSMLEDSSESDDDDDDRDKKPKAGVKKKKKKPLAVAKKKSVLGLPTLVKTTASAKRKIDAAGKKSKSNKKPKKKEEKEVKDHCVDCKTGCKNENCPCRQAGRKCSERCTCNKKCCNQPKKKGAITAYFSSKSST